MTKTSRANAELPITGIGSLPHHNVDAALAFSFQMGIPFLPQIPIRNPWEFMIAQALEGIPGLHIEADASIQLNVDIWHSRANALNKRLSEAFESQARDAFEAFEPSAASSSSWQPFLWELEEHGVKRAKIQIAGPLTSQWALRLSDGKSPEKYPDLSTQIFRLVTARALGMSKRLQAEGVEPIVYLDEPALYCWDPSNPRHVLALQELKILVQTLRKEGVQVGLHCCSNTHWEAVLGLGLHYLSVDTSLSLESLLAAGEGRALKTFIEGGGKLSLGVIPTTRSSALHSLSVPALKRQLLKSFEQAWGAGSALTDRVLSEAIFTPACGLAYQSAADAEFILETLTGFAHAVRPH
ncbi:MAG: hypothetical protein ACXWPM_08360 [Bdellovibrionota bacterium]